MRTHRTWIELSSDALANNIRAVRSCIEKDVSLIAVVKSNAYGHGIAEMVRLFDRHHVHQFGVDSIEEALQIRELLPQATILTLGYIPDELLGQVVAHDIQPTLYHKDQLLKLNTEATRAGKKISVHFKIETGTARQGCFPEALPQLIQEGLNASHLTIVGLSTHLANAENLQATASTRKQISTFYATVGSVAENLPDLKTVHVACSAAVLSHPESHGTAVRVGLALYGCWPSVDVEQDVLKRALSIRLQPVLSWYSRVAQIKDYPAGTPIGYGGTEILNRPTRVAVIPVGYYDGFDRGLSRRGEVLIRGHRCKVLGTVCMNILMVDASRIPAITHGDRVTLIGVDGSNRISAEDLAKEAQTISWEILARLSAHLPRVVV